MGRDGLLVEGIAMEIPVGSIYLRVAERVAEDGRHEVVCVRQGDNGGREIRQNVVRIGDEIDSSKCFL